MPYFSGLKGVALVLALSISIAPAASPRNHLSAPIQSVASSGANAKPALLSSGTAIVAKLLTSVDSSKFKPGDAVEAEITRDVSQNHKVVLKRGTRVLGHIVAVSADSVSGTESRLAISFNSVTMKGGGQAQISFVIQALAREPVLQNQVDLLDGRGSEGHPAYRDGLWWQRRGTAPGRIASTGRLGRLRHSGSEPGVDDNQGWLSGSHSSIHRRANRDGFQTSPMGSM